jgi:hypothetical protein
VVNLLYIYSGVTMQIIGERISEREREREREREVFSIRYQVGTINSLESFQSHSINLQHPTPIITLKTFQSKFKNNEEKGGV